MPLKDPYFPFYAEDWLSDEKLRACSVAARGLWIDVLCLMHKNDRRGFLQLNGKPVTAEQLARMTGSSTDEVSQLLEELFNAGVYSVGSNGVIHSRRMVRDESLRQTRRETGRLGADARWNVENHGKLMANMMANSWQKDGKQDGKGMPLDPDPEPDPNLGKEFPKNPSYSEPENPASEQKGPMIFPIARKDGDGQWLLTSELLAELSELFPSTDVVAELRRALAWLLANPRKRKTAKNMRKFLTGWLSRANDWGRSVKSDEDQRMPRDESAIASYATAEKEVREDRSF